MASDHQPSALPVPPSVPGPWRILQRCGKLRMCEVHSRLCQYQPVRNNSRKTMKWRLKKIGWQLFLWVFDTTLPTTGCIWLPILYVTSVYCFYIKHPFSFRILITQNSSLHSSHTSPIITFFSLCENPNSCVLMLIHTSKQRAPRCSRTMKPEEFHSSCAFPSCSNHPSLPA